MKKLEKGVDEWNIVRYYSYNETETTGYIMKKFRITLMVRSKNFTHNGRSTPQVEVIAICKTQKAFLALLEDAEGIRGITPHHCRTYGSNMPILEDETLKEDTIYISGNYNFFKNAEGETVRIDKPILLEDF